MRPIVFVFNCAFMSEHEERGREREKKKASIITQEGECMHACERVCVCTLCVWAFSALCKQTERSLKQGREKCAAWKYHSCCDMPHLFPPSLQARLSARHPNRSELHQLIGKYGKEIHKLFNLFSETVLVYLIVFNETLRKCRFCCWRGRQSERLLHWSTQP